MLDQYSDLQRRRRKENDAIESGEHNDYRLYDELHADIADLLIDNAEALTGLLGRLDSLAEAVTERDTAAEDGEDDDAHDEAIRVAARDLAELVGGSATPDESGRSTKTPNLDELRKAHTRALQAADGDSNDDEIEAWRDTAALATALLPGYQDPIID
ncbi:MAG: hypothetical protein DI630_31075 [Gordonia sp. (in: high G+C Gram-positive bacteria)]|nr:MAG: hypothetical protein DI630_31075 [Gordonia sp. (in: high G+C Gram-positive bacteria)]